MGDTAGGVLRRSSDRIVAGVCSGLGDYLNLDHTVVRVVFAVVTIASGGAGIIVYLILWFLMVPAGTAGSAPRTISDRLRQMGDEVRREFGGGLSGSHAAAATPGAPPPGTGTTDASPPGTAPSGTTPPAGDPGAGHRRSWGWGWGGRYPGKHRGGLWAGIILIALGVYILLDNLGYLDGFRWDIFWPVVLIAIGLLVLFRRAR